MPFIFDRKKHLEQTNEHCEVSQNWSIDLKISLHVYSIMVTE